MCIKYRKKQLHLHIIVLQAGLTISKSFLDYKMQTVTILGKEGNNYAWAARIRATVIYGSQNSEERC